MVEACFNVKNISQLKRAEENDSKIRNIFETNNIICLLSINQIIPNVIVSSIMERVKFWVEVLLAYSIHLLICDNCY